MQQMKIICTIVEGCTDVAHISIYYLGVYQTYIYINTYINKIMSLFHHHKAEVPIIGIGAFRRNIKNSIIIDLQLDKYH